MIGASIAGGEQRRQVVHDFICGAPAHIFREQGPLEIKLDEISDGEMERRSPEPPQVLGPSLMAIAGDGEQGGLAVVSERDHTGVGLHETAILASGTFGCDGEQVAHAKSLQSPSHSHNIC